MAGKPSDTEQQSRRKDLRNHALSYAQGLVASRRIKDKAGVKNFPHIMSISREIHRLRDIEQEIIEQKILFETMFNALADGVVITNTRREILLANRGMETTFGYRPEELIGQSTQILYADTRNFQAAGASLYDSGAEPKDQTYVTGYKHKAGLEFIGETFGAKLYDQNNKWIGNLGIIRDISLRQKSEAERNRLIAAVAQTQDTIVITDCEGNIQYVNPAFEATTGYTRDEVLNQNPRLLKSGEQDQDFYQQMWQTLQGGGTFKGRMVNKRKDGTLFTEEATISPILDDAGQIISFVAVKRDITKQISLEAQLQQAQKMEAVGRLTGGVAHDFNNLLGVIIGYTEMALEELDPAQKVHGDLQKIREAAERSAGIVRQLLAFSRKQTISPKTFDLNAAVHGMLQMLRRLIGENIELAWLPEPGTLLVRMDPTQLDQILANLCVNAKDAIDAHGKITIETSRAVFDDEYCRQHLGFQPGSFVQLSISDNGCGIDKNAQSFIFEPFYSTKELGRGTGLGLSTVYGIVKQNNGFINVYSELGSGTTLKIYLPCWAHGQLEVSRQTAAKTRDCQGETVLLVEDEPVLLAMAQQMLKRLGYNVLIADRPGEAVKIAQHYPGIIDLVFTDVVMPEMTGKEMVRQIQLHYPDLQVLFMSGYTANVIAHNGILDEGVQFIQKPYSIEQLADKLRTILDGA